MKILVEVENIETKQYHTGMYDRNNEPDQLEVIGDAELTRQ